MTGRSDSEQIEPDRGNASGRLMFGGALIFAVLATLVLVFTTNAEWLKLAVIAALWAAFFGAMLSVKYRHQAAVRASEVADLQAVYELELEREVAARREYELEVEADTRRRIAEETEESSREDVAALRAELRALRENLDRLTGGEVLVERIALRAQSTRMRALGESNLAPRAITTEDERRSITAGPATNPGRIPGNGPSRGPGRGPSRGPVRTVGAVLDPSTELLEPAPVQRQAQRPDNPRPDTHRVEAPRDQRRPGPARVPAPQVGEQSRNNVRREQINPPLPRQPSNSGAYPLAGNSGVYPPPSNTGTHPVARPAAAPPDPRGAHRVHRDNAHRGPAPDQRRQDDEGAQGGRHTSGSHHPVPRPAAMPAAPMPAYASAGGRRAQPEPAGAHTAGRSVTELLAAHSPNEDSPRRHRRRAD